MNCTEAQKRIRPYLEHTLQDKDMAAFLDHIDSCAECREELELSLAIYGTGSYKEEYEKKIGDNFPLRLARMMEQDRKRLKHIRTEHITSVSILLAALMLLGLVLYFSIVGVPWAGNEEPEDKPAAEAVTESVTEAVTESVTEEATVTTYEAVSESTAESTDEAVSESTTEEASEAPAAGTSKTKTK